MANLNTPRMHTSQALDATDFSSEQSHGDDGPATLPILLPKVGRDDHCEPASVGETLLVIGGSSVGLVVLVAALSYAVPVVLAWVRS